MAHGSHANSLSKERVALPPTESRSRFTSRMHWLPESKPTTAVGDKTSRKTGLGLTFQSFAGGESIFDFLFEF